VRHGSDLRGSAACVNPHPLFPLSVSSSSRCCNAQREPGIDSQTHTDTDSRAKPLETDGLTDSHSLSLSLSHTHTCTHMHTHAHACTYTCKAETRRAASSTSIGNTQYVFARAPRPTCVCVWKESDRQDCSRSCWIKRTSARAGLGLDQEREGA
jgi:hypothetical protein